MNNFENNELKVILEKIVGQDTKRFTLKEVSQESYIIPGSLLKLNISDSSKVIYSLILDSDINDMYLSIQDMSNIINSNIRTTASHLNELIEYNLINELNDDEKYNILSNKKFDNLGIGINICEWCHIKTTYLHSHHYPIKKSMGGTNTVNICQVCHSEFHNRLFTINPENEIYKSLLAKEINA